MRCVCAPAFNSCTTRTACISTICPKLNIHRNPYTILVLFAFNTFPHITQHRMRISHLDCATIQHSTKSTFASPVIFDAGQTVHTHTLNRKSTNRIAKAPLHDSNDVGLLCGMGVEMIAFFFLVTRDTCSAAQRWLKNNHMRKSGCLCIIFHRATSKKKRERTLLSTFRLASLQDSPNSAEAVERLACIFATIQFPNNSQIQVSSDVAPLLWRQAALREFMRDA